MSEPLTPATIAIVKATVPALAEHGTAITTAMYARLFQDEHIRALFNHANQGESGAQVHALAAAILAFAQNIENLGALVPVVERIAYKHVGSSHDFDATVIAKDDAGKVQIVKRHDEPTRHGAAVGLNWGIAAGAVAALFPAVGLIGGVVLGAGGGAALGAVAGHARGGTSHDDLTALGEVLEEGDAGLVVVYAADMADQVATNVRAARRTARGTTNVSAEQLAADIRAAESAEGG